MQTSDRTKALPESPLNAGRVGASPRVRHADARPAHLQTWGSSLGLRIPRGLAEQLGPAAGSQVSLSARDGDLLVSPALPARLKLEDRLAEVTPANLPSSVDIGDAVGQEFF